MHFFDLVSFSNNVFARAADGDLLMCGSNENSQLGWNPTRPPSHVSLIMEDGTLIVTDPTRVASLDALSVHNAVMGPSHTVAVVGEGVLFTWGANDLGQLGEIFRKFESMQV